MPVVITRLIQSYAVLVLANQGDPSRGIPLEDVPEVRVMGGIDYPIRSEVEIEVARRVVEAIG